jgi:hypothetical protein
LKLSTVDAAAVSTIWQLLELPFRPPFTAFAPAQVIGRGEIAVGSLFALQYAAAAY